MPYVQEHSQNSNHDRNIHGFFIVDPTLELDKCASCSKCPMGSRSVYWNVANFQCWRWSVAVILMQYFIPWDLNSLKLTRRHRRRHLHLVCFLGIHRILALHLVSGKAVHLSRHPPVGCSWHDLEKTPITIIIWVKSSSFLKKLPINKYIIKNFKSKFGDLPKCIHLSKLVGLLHKVLGKDYFLPRTIYLSSISVQPTDNGNWTYRLMGHCCIAS